MDLSTFDTKDLYTLVSWYNGNHYAYGADKDDNIVYDKIIIELRCRGEEV